jgi:tubulin beta
MPKTQIQNSILANHSGISILFKTFAKQFYLMLKRKAFLHRFTGEGMEEMEFEEARLNAEDLVSEYQLLNSEEEQVDI